ncbi:MAG: DUF5691 domain-containing protein, partial [Armatimonadota bacterium]
LADGRPACPPRARECLAVMLSGQHAEALPEWLSLLHGSGARVPEEYLPALLDMGSRNDNDEKAVAAVAGERGRWLAQLNPGWTYVIGEKVPDASTWPSATPEEHALIFASLRRQDPARARELLASSWAGMERTERERLLPDMAIALSMEDEPFLESILDDKSKEIRKQVIELLAQLPESAFSRRMRERLDAVLLYAPAQPARIFPPSAGSKARLDVTLPDQCAKTMQRDGIENKVPAEVKRVLINLGEKGWWLLQMLSLTPPGYWCECWGQSPEQLLELVQGNEWRDAIRNGWAQATLRFRDAAWAKSLYPLTLQSLSHNLYMPWVSFLKLLPPAYWEEITIKALFGRQADTEMLPPALELLHSYPGPWTLRLAEAVWKRTQELLASSRLFNDNYWSGSGVLLVGFSGAFATKAPESMLPEAAGVLQQVLASIPESPYKSYWDKTLGNTLSLMQFRIWMNSAFV